MTNEAAVPRLTNRNRRHVTLHNDLTPMVDVAMLLLTFFMLTTVFNKPQTMEFRLPETDGTTDIAQSNILFITSDAAGSLRCGIGSAASEPATLPLLREIAERHQRAASAAIAIIRIHRNAPYQSMIDIIDELNNAGLTRFSIQQMPVQS